MPIILDELGFYGFCGWWVGGGCFDDEEMMIIFWYRIFCGFALDQIRLIWFGSLYFWGRRGCTFYIAFYFALLMDDDDHELWAKCFHMDFVWWQYRNGDRVPSLSHTHIYAFVVLLTFFVGRCFTFFCSVHSNATYCLFFMGDNCSSFCWRDVQIGTTFFCSYCNVFLIGFPIHRSQRSGSLSL